MPITRPRIAVAAFGNPRDPRIWSGTSANIVRALERLGVEVVGIDATAISKLERLFYFALYQIWRLALSPRVPWKRQLHAIFSLERSDYNLMDMLRNRRARHVEREMRARGVSQVIHMQHHALPTAPPKFPALSHCLVLDSTQRTEYAQQQSLHPGRRPERINRSIRQSERQMFENAAHLFPVAEYLRDDLVHSYVIPAAKVTFVGTGLGGLKPFHGEKDYVNGHILFVARWRFEEKGGALLVDAFQRAHRVNPRLKLVLVGQEENRKLYGSLPGVTAYGLIPGDDLQRLFDTAALFAMPAPVEPYGLVFQEALAGKTPILGLNRNAVPELCGNGRYGFMVDEPDAQLVADALLNALSDPRRLKRMGAEGQEYILNRYSWDNTAHRICRALGIVPQTVSQEEAPRVELPLSISSELQLHAAP